MGIFMACVRVRVRVLCDGGRFIYSGQREREATQKKGEGRKEKNPPPVHCAASLSLLSLLYV